MLATTMLRLFSSLLILFTALTARPASITVPLHPLQVVQEQRTIHLTLPASLFISKLGDNVSTMVAHSYDSLEQEARAHFTAANPLDTSLDSEDYHRVGDYEDVVFTLPYEDDAPRITVTLGATVVLQPWSEEQSIAWKFEQPSITIELPDTITHHAVAAYPGLPLLMSIWITGSYKVVCVQRLQ